MKKESVGLLRAWLQAYKTRRLTMGSGEQNSLMVALQQNPAYRFFPLPDVYNFRYSNVLPRHGPRLPLVLHSNAFETLPGSSGDGEALVDGIDYRAVGREVAVTMLGDTVKRVRQQCAPFAFDCDLLTLA